MDELVYEALCRYFNTLEKTGYMSYPNMIKLLVLVFFWDFVYSDFRCSISKDDYLAIERALNCLFGTTCLIPYPDYLKMGKLHLGRMTELACRVKAIEDSNVVKVIHDLTTVSSTPESDIVITIDEADNSNSGNNNDNGNGNSGSNPTEVDNPISGEVNGGNTNSGTAVVV